jgi:hypothetical protein
MPYVGATEFYEKSRSKKNRSKFFCCYLIHN